MSQNVEIALAKNYYWRKNNLTVSFLDGDPVVERKIINIVKKWEDVCSIKFLFGAYADADITISFLYRGSWSYIGSYSTQVRPSMNFGWLDKATPDSEYNRVVLHEFGHALGFIHEHMQPNANIPWDKEKVYKYYNAPPNNWDKTMVDQNIFAHYNREEIYATAFDTASIMLYGIPASLTTNGFHTNDNYTLSETDKSFVATIYPK